MYDLSNIIVKIQEKQKKVSYSYGSFLRNIYKEKLTEINKQRKTNYTKSAKGKNKKKKHENFIDFFIYKNRYKKLSSMEEDSNENFGRVFLKYNLYAKELILSYALNKSKWFLNENIQYDGYRKEIRNPLFHGNLLVSITKNINYKKFFKEIDNKLILKTNLINNVNNHKKQLHFKYENNKNFLTTKDKKFYSTIKNFLDIEAKNIKNSYESINKNKNEL